MEKPMGERVAVIEDWRLRVDGDIESLRMTRHEHANHLQTLILKQAQVQEDVSTITEKVMPEVKNALETMAVEIRKISEKVSTQQTNLGWLKSNAMWLLQLVQGVALLLLAVALKVG